jgi:signal recognition particle subunit SRP19
MRTRKPFLIFWPQYFDMKKTRHEGRRLPKNLAIEKVSIEDIAKAARRLGYKANIEQSYRYPKCWWEPPGRVAIDAKGKKKTKLINEVAKELRKMRS